MNVGAPEFISSEILAFLFIALCALVIISLHGGFHVKTKSFTLFCYAELILCVARAAFVAIPSGLRREDQSTSIPSYSIDYWINFASFTLFLIGSCASIISWLVILHMIVMAIHVATQNHRRSAGFSFAIKCSAAIYSFFEVTLIVSFIFVPYDHIVIAWSVFSAAYSAALAIAFLYANARFWSVMGKVVLQTATSSDELSTTDNQSQSQAVDDTDAHALATPFVSPGRSHNAAISLAGEGTLNYSHADGARVPITSALRENARHKLRRITQVALLCTLCSVVKAALEGFQVAELLIPNSSVQDSGYFWLVGLLYYLFSEVIPGLLVLLALRKPTSSVHPSISPVVLVGESSTQTPLQRGTFGEEMQSEQRSERGASMYSAASSAWYHDAGHDERDEAMYT